MRRALLRSMVARLLMFRVSDDGLWKAGIAPKIRLVIAVIATVRRRTGQFIQPLARAGSGKFASCALNISGSTCTPHHASRTPAPVPITARVRPCIRNCLKSRPLLAPNASRMATSRSCVPARASNIFPTLAQAMINMNSTDTWRTHSAGRTFPV